MMPVDATELQHLLQASQYSDYKSQKLLSQLRDGFDLGYRGPVNRVSEAKNIPLSIGSPTECWNKIMKEVKAKRYAGHFTQEQLPFKYFVQSPIGLVPKAGGKTRLIFHLSHDFRDAECEKLINYHTCVQLSTMIWTMQ